MSVIGTRPGQQRSELRDLVGIGLGPSNLAVAIQIEEARKSAGAKALNAIFLERKKTFSWHAGMQLPGTRIQSPFLKDLVTQSDPTSRFTFLNYLKETNRIEQFINLRQFYPTRAEFEDYFAWAAELCRTIRFGANVEWMRPIENGGKVTHIDVGYVCDGLERVLRTTSLSIAVGRTPKAMPAAALGSARIVHSAHFCDAYAAYQAQYGKAPASILIVGAGQSGAEIAKFLLEQKVEKVTVVSKHFLFRGLDASNYVNEFYTEPGTQNYRLRSSHERRQLKAELSSSNYGSVDADLIREIYGQHYDDSVRHRGRLQLDSYITLRDLEENDDAVVATLSHEPSGTIKKMSADMVVMATGYDDRYLIDLLRPLSPYLRDDHNGLPIVDGAYRLVTGEDFLPQIHVHGLAEESHGFTVGTITNLGPRAAQIVSNVARRHVGESLVEHGA